jgi:branched-chain amino acid:cation transporter, LIVCS family
MFSVIKGVHRMKTNKIFRDSLIFGFAFFAVFLGAGNLIFPPSIGFVSGTDCPTALAGLPSFLISGTY